MRRLIISVATALAGMMVFAGCGEDIIGSDGMESGIFLTVTTSAPELTVKGTPVGGVDTYNENKLTSFYYYFFPKDVTDQPAVVSGSASGFSTTGSYTEEIPVSSNDLNSVLFSGDRQCSLFIIANPTESMNTVLGNSSVTLAQLRAATVLSSMDGVQDSFVMVYDDHVTIDSRVESKAIEVSVALKRLACKFTFNADVKSQIQIVDHDKTLTWTAMTGADALYVSLGNAINRTTPAGFDEESVEDADYFDSTPVEMTYNGEVSDKTVDDVLYRTYSATLPIYSYPMDWVFTDEHEPYIMFDFQWDFYDGTAQRAEHRYYKLMLGQQSITANDWYVITAKLTGIGSLLPRDPVSDYDNLNYLVHDWNDAFLNQNAPNTSANIKAANYLMVPQTAWVMNNEESVSIPFTSSNDCELVDIEVSKTQFYGYDEDYPNRPGTITYTAANISTIGMEFKIKDSKIVMTHPLDNDINSSTFDYSKYEISFTLQHKDDPTYSQEITITQYPAIWIETELNSAGENDMADGGTSHKGYVYVNNSNDVTEGSRWNKVLGSSSGSTGNNTSRYMTVIHISQFEDPSYYSASSFSTSDFNSGFEFSYIIGDPRSTTVNNLHNGSGTWTYTQTSQNSWTEPACAYVNDIYGGGQRYLSYYYPAVDTQDYFSYVAPVLRVNSAHAHLSASLKYRDAQKRCATYQEDGYPAGRWRLPTMAEMYVINTLSNKSIIPSIFMGSRYWFAGGYYNGGDGRNNHYIPVNVLTDNQTRSMRCVYDEWYWSVVDNAAAHEDDPNWRPLSSKTTFTWGDKER